MQIRNPDMTNSAEIQTIAFRAVEVVHKAHPSAPSHARPGVACTRMRYRPRSSSIASLVAEVWVVVLDRLVRFHVDTANACRTANDRAGGGMFSGGGPQFVFNMGGGPGFTVHRMGGATPRRRPRDANGREEPPPSGLAALTQLLPLLLLFILPLLSSLFSGSPSSGPSVRFDSPVPPQTMHRITPKYRVDYFINPAEVEGYSARKFHQLDQRAEVDYISTLQYNCEVERNTRSQMLQDAQGWFSIDEEKVRQARQMPMRSCSRLDELRVARQY